MVDKPTLSDKDVKTVPMADFMAQKRKAEKLEAELEKRTGERDSALSSLAQVKTELKVAKVSEVDDDEVVKVKKSLLEEDERIRAGKEKFDKDLASLKKRELEVEAKVFATKYGVKVEDISGEETIEAMKIKALELHAEQLVKAKEETPEPESVFESGAGGLFKKKVADMDNKEFDQAWDKQKQEALSKKV